MDVLAIILFIVGGLVVCYGIFAAVVLIKRKQGKYDTALKKLATEKNEDFNAYKQKINKSDRKIAIISLAVGFALIFVGVIALSSGGGSGGTSSGSKNTCGVCGRSWSAGDSGGNFMSIARTHMCVNCYNNYQYSQKMLGR